LIIKSYCKIPYHIEKYNPILIEGIIKEKKLKILKKKKSSLIVELEGIYSRSEIEEIKGNYIYKNQTDFPKLDDEEYYFFELKNLQVFDSKLKKIGKVIDVGDYGGGTFLEILFFDNRKSELIPFTKENFTFINKKENFIVLSSISSL
tara:strand:+ start:329 stop:772 length:444 start_codon:yes stop_codon:yes gene_type:complete